MGPLVLRKKFSKVNEGFTIEERLKVRLLISSLVPCYKDFRLTGSVCITELDCLDRYHVYFS